MFTESRGEILLSNRIRAGRILFSPGPDEDYDIRHPEEVYDSELKQPSPLLITFAYDATNGTKSSGDVFRVKQSQVGSPTAQ